MTERGARIAALAAAIAAVTAVVLLLVTTYRQDAATTVAGAPTTPPIGNVPAPAGPIGSASGSATPSRYAGHDDTGDTRPDGAHQPILDRRDQAAVRATTTSFLRAWLRPGTESQRRRRLAPYATVQLTRLLALTAPANLPSARVRRTPEILGADTYTAATLTQLSDGQRVRCHLIRDPTGWRVSELLPASGTPATKAR